MLFSVRVCVCSQHNLLDSFGCYADRQPQKDMKPNNYRLCLQPCSRLQVLVGTGSQMFGMSCFLIVFAAVGFLSPANRGSLMIAFLALFVLMATFAGYTSAVMGIAVNLSISGCGVACCYTTSHCTCPDHVQNVRRRTMAEMHFGHSSAISGYGQSMRGSWASANWTRLSFFCLQMPLHVQG